MALFWLCVPVAFPGLIGLQGPIEPQSPQGALPPLREVRVDSTLTISAPEPTYDFRKQEAVFTGGVTARYGVTKIVSERLRLSNAPGKQFGIAENGVVLTDPDLTIQASRLEFSWDPTKRRFIADNVEIRIAGAVLKAKHADLTPTLWTFQDVSLTSCGDRVPLYLVTAPKLTVTPGKTGRIDRPSLFLRGTKLFTLPGQTFNLDRRAIGLRPPGPGYRQDAGVGLNWIAGFMLNEQTSLTANFDTFPRSLPGYGLVVTRSFIKAEDAAGLVAPRTELGERFSFGYFESVENPSPSSEENNLRSKRHSISLGSTWNQGIAARLVNPATSKAFEVAYEYGGPIGAFAGLSQIRLQTINENRDPFVTRLVAQSSLLAPSLSVGKDLSTVIRADVSGFGGRNTFGWARANVGVVFEPSKLFRMGVSYVAAREFGRPEFEFDRLYARDGYVVRTDLNFGATRFSLMHKYDLNRSWYDREISVNQVIGCLEAFYLSRQFPRDYRIGIRLRLDPFIDLLQRRKLERGPSARQKITQPIGLP